MTEHLYNINHYFPAERIPDAFKADYYKIFTEMNEAGDEYFKGEPSSRLVKRLNNCYWDALTLLVKIRVRDPLFESIGFSEEERPLVDFGLLSGRFMRGAGDLDVMRKDSSSHEHHEGFNILTFAQEIRSRYVGIIADPEVVALRRDAEMRERELEAVEERFRKARDRRGKVFRYIKDAERVVKLALSIEERLPLYAKLQFKISRSIRLDTAEAETVRAVERDIHILSEAEKRVIRNRRDLAQVAELDTVILRTALEIPKVTARIGELRERIQNRLRDAEDSSPSTRFAKLSTELVSIQKLYPQLSGRESARGVLPVYFAESTGVTKPRVVERIKEVLEIDKVLKKNWHDHVWKKPDIIIVPGLGDGIFDPARDALWVSRRNLYPFKDPIVSAIALYRLAKSEGMAERYREVKKMPRRARAAAVAEEFVKEFNDCVLREAKGYRKLTGKLQKWFRYELAYEEGA